MTVAPARDNADGSGGERATLAITTTTKQQARAGGCEQAQRRRFRHGGDATERLRRSGSRGCQNRSALGEERAVDQEVVVAVDRAAVIKVAVDPARLVPKEPGVDLEVVVAGDGS